MSREGLKLTAYFGERDRTRDAFVADALAAVLARHGIGTSVVLRGMEGFGAKHHLRTDRQLTLSEDLPLVAVAVDERARIEAALEDVRALPFAGLVTLERAALLDDDAEPPPAAPAAGDEAKLTLYLGRGQPHRAAVDLLHRHGVAGATVLLGVDGTLHGERRRARFLGANAGVPLMVIAVGDVGRIEAALGAVRALVPDVRATLEHVRVCRRDGVRLAEPHAPAGPAGWQKIMVYIGEQSKHAGAPLHEQLVRRLRAEGAAGATTLRGIWGYHGDHEPHGDALLALRRRVPVVCTIVDEPQRARRWFAVVDELTAETGLVTSELVPTTVLSA